MRSSNEISLYNILFSQRITRLTQILLSIYNLAWLVARPFLKRSERISLGWQQRTLNEITPGGPFDLWIQSASGGESMLTVMVLSDLAHRLPADKVYTILVTSGTKQGVDSLKKGCQPLQSSSLTIRVAYFPFDAPALMKKAFMHFSPKLAVIVETELWPSFLFYANQHKVPTLLINGRMSKKSFATYKYFHSFFNAYGPKQTWAISTDDASRFSQVFGEGRVQKMNNIKFDRIQPVDKQNKQTNISVLIPSDTPFVLFGSIRRAEEAIILRSIEQLLSRVDNVIIGLFPKHIERAESWQQQLEKKGINAVKRSATETACKAGTVIVWDLFGELAGAYELAKTTFIGGSLVDLGGQNFLEPLVFGLKPIIGPYWSNFAWVSRDIIDEGLVYEVQNEQELSDKLLIELDSEESREQTIEQVQDFLSPRKGGTALASKVITTYLNS